MSKSDGMSYAPRAKAKRVVKPGEFRFGAIGLDHGHIDGMCYGLVDAGGEPAAVYDPDPDKVASFVEKFPDAKPAGSEEELLSRNDIALIASAAVPADRGPLGLRVLDSGKHYFSDKAPFTTLEQVEAARRKVSETGLKWAVCYSERVQTESGVLAGEMIGEGAIGTVLQVIGLGPHRLNIPSRPDWFFRRERYGGILIDIGSHQVEQFLYYTGARSATVMHSKVANFNHPEFPELDDFGDATLVADNGATNYFRVDWFTPDGLGTWGDGRTIILGTDGYMELRKYTNVGTDEGGEHIFLVDGSREQHIKAAGTVGFPYFGELILDCLNGTDNAMDQEHAFTAAELCITAQLQAVHLDASPVRSG